MANEIAPKLLRHLENACSSMGNINEATLDLPIRVILHNGANDASGHFDATTPCPNDV